MIWPPNWFEYFLTLFPILRRAEPDPNRLAEMWRISLIFPWKLQPFFQKQHQIIYFQLFLLSPWFLFTFIQPTAPMQWKHCTWSISRLLHLCLNVIWNIPLYFVHHGFTCEMVEGEVHDFTCPCDETSKQVNFSDRTRRNSNNYWNIFPRHLK